MKMIHAAFGVVALWLWAQVLPLLLSIDELSNELAELGLLEWLLAFMALMGATILATVTALWPAIRPVLRFAVRIRLIA